MRWLMISLIVSLVMLLIAAAGMAYHIWEHHRQLRRTPAIGAEEAIEQAEESDLEL
jgi:uncharacterized membrane protein